MSRLSADHNVAKTTVQWLRRRGHDVIAAQERMRERDPDYVYLRNATAESRVLITYDAEDFTLLHGAWHSWSEFWGTDVPHPGILVVPQPPRLSPDAAAVLIDQFLQSQPALTNELLIWRSTSGWQRHIL